MRSSANNAAISGTLEVSPDDATADGTPPDPGDTLRLPAFERPAGYDALIQLD